MNNKVTVSQFWPCLAIEGQNCEIASQMIYEIPWPMLLSKFLPLLVLYFSLFNIHSHTPEEENFPILTCEPDSRGEFFTSEIMGSIVLSNTNSNSGSILATLYKKLKYFTCAPGKIFSRDFILE